MSHEELRAHLHAMAEHPQGLETLTEALHHPATEYTALCALKKWETPAADAVLIQHLMNKGQRDRAAAQQIITELDRIPRLAARNALQRFDSFPLSALFTLMGVATDAEYADFLAWRATLSTPYLTVGVIDDDKDGCKLLSMMINLQGDMVTVGQARDASTGAEMASRLQPDVIFVDDMMPGLSGGEAIKHVLQAAPQSAVIMRTNRGIDAIVEGFEAGAVDAIGGPIWPQELPKIIHKAYAAALARK